MKEEKKQLRSGFTTGTCAAAAAKAAALFLTGDEKTQISLQTPGGRVAHFQVQKLVDGEMTWFGVQKDAGDDPDVTHGAWIYGAVSRISKDMSFRRSVESKSDRTCEKKETVEKHDVDQEAWTDVLARAYEWEPDTDADHSGQFRLFLTAKDGIGLVTKPGLSCPVGNYAINPVPRQMIFQSVTHVLEETEAHGDYLIQLWIPAGRELALKTFNPKLGIEGGISILGTTGIVNPMSEQALMDTIRLEIHMRAVAGEHRLILAPGNYGERFLSEHLGIAIDQAVTCSNFIADAIRWSADAGMSEILFVGHIGKLIKVAGGVKNTHSKYGDRRMEIMADCLPGTLDEQVRNEWTDRILGCNTTEEALEYLKSWGICDQVMHTAVSRMQHYMKQWAGGNCDVQVVTFSTVYGILGKTSDSDRMIERWRQS